MARATPEQKEAFWSMRSLAFAAGCIEEHPKLRLPTLPKQGRVIPWTTEPWDKIVREADPSRGTKERRVVSRDTDAPGFFRRSQAKGATWDDYDRIVVMFSGGKDSLASLLWLLDAGAPREKIELWHQNVDGESSVANFLDWPVTEAYLESVAAHFGLPLLYQWRIGGIRAEMERKGRHFFPVVFEVPVDGNGKPVHTPQIDARTGRVRVKTLKITSEGGDPKIVRGWPAKRADLRYRWCSAHVKMDPAAKALRGMFGAPRSKKAELLRFDGRRLGRVPRVLYITGERRAESKGRATYRTLEGHDKTSTPGQRIVHHWRPILHLDEGQVWALLKRWGVQPHPSYELGWGRCSCFGCIFSLPRHWALMKRIAPQTFERLARQDEWNLRSTGQTMTKGRTLREMAKKGMSEAKALLDTADPRVQHWISVALGRTRFTPAMVAVEPWCLPRGAFSGAEGGAPNRTHAPGCPLAPRGRQAKRESVIALRSWRSAGLRPGIRPSDLARWNHLLALAGVGGGGASLDRRSGQIMLWVWPDEEEPVSVFRGVPEPDDRSWKPWTRSDIEELVRWLLAQAR